MSINKLFSLPMFYLSLVTLSLMNLYATYTSTFLHTSNMLLKQTLFIALASILYFCVYKYITKPPTYQARILRFYQINLLILAIAVFLSSLMFILPESLVPSINGANRWIKLGGVSIAPVEILKISIVFIFTHILTSDKFLKHSNTKSFKILAPFLIIFIIISALVTVKQKDFGNFVLIGVSFTMLVFIFFDRLRLIFQITILGSVALVLFIVTSPHRIDRILQWMNASQQSGNIDSNYQVVQGLKAVYESGFFGVGFGKSTMKLGYIPDLQTDMIFTVFISEAGIFGFLLYYVLLIFLMLYFVTKFISLRALYGILFSVVSAFLIIFQSIINLFGVLSIVPLKGISVPFLSYGGSSTAGIFVLLALNMALLKTFSENTEISL